MPSQIDPTKPVDGAPAIKADLRANLQSAKAEIEALQTGKTDLGHQHVLADVTDSGALASKDVVQSDDVAAAAITTAKLAAAAVGVAQLADAAVTTAKLADAAVTSDKLAAASVTVGKIASAAVDTAGLADDAVTRAKIAHGTANTLFGFDASGAPAEVAAGSHVTISGGTIAVVPGSLTELTDTPSSYLAQGGRFLRANVGETAVEFALINANALADGAVANAKLADAAVSAAKIGPAAVGTANLAAAAVTSDKIADGAVAIAKLANAAVTSPKIASNAVDSGKIAAAAVSTDKIADGAISTAKLADAAVTSAKIAANAVDSSKIVAAAVTAPKLAAGFLDPIEDAGNHSLAPFTVAEAYSTHRFFTDAHDHIIQFPAGLSVDPATHGRFTAPPGNTLALRRVGGSGVSINGVASDGFTWVVPASGTVEWLVRASNTIELRGDTTAEQLLVGPLDANDQSIERPHLIDVAEGYTDAGSRSAAASFDYQAGGWQKCVAIGNITSVAVTNPPASGRVGALTLEIHQDGTGNRTIAWGPAFRFPGGTDFALSTAASAIDIFTLITRDGGTTWYAFEGGKAFAA